MTLVPVKEYPELRVQHADQLPDEASLLMRLRLHAGERCGVPRGGPFFDLSCCRVRRDDTAGLSWTFFTISMLNGLSYGLLLFMLSSGLTLIFSMMGVLNFRARQLLHGGRLRRLYACRQAASASGPRW
jgi:hypothetical protein